MEAFVLLMILGLQSYTSLVRKQYVPDLIRRQQEGLPSCGVDAAVSCVVRCLQPPRHRSFQKLVSDTGTKSIEPFASIARGKPSTDQTKQEAAPGVQDAQ